MAPRASPLRATGFVALAAFTATVAASGGCVKIGDSLGQSCLTNEDCFSGYCAQQICVSAPPLLDAEVKGDAPADRSAEAATGDAGGDADASAPEAGADSSRDATSDALPESSADAAGGEGGSDAPADVAEGG